MEIRKVLTVMCCAFVSLFGSADSDYMKYVQWGDEIGRASCRERV